MSQASYETLMLGYIGIMVGLIFIKLVFKD